MQRTDTSPLHSLRCRQIALGQSLLVLLPSITWWSLAVQVAEFVTLVAVERVGY